MINAKDERIKILENRVNELEQHSRKHIIIVSGLNLHSYAHTTTRSRSARTPTQTNDGNDINESSTMIKNFVKFAEEKLSVSVAEIEITAIHDLPKCKDCLAPVIVQFLSTDKKTEIMRKRKMFKGSVVFLNDHLTQRPECSKKNGK